MKLNILDRGDEIQQKYATYHLALRAYQRKNVEQLKVIQKDPQLSQEERLLLRVRRYSTKNNRQLSQVLAGQVFRHDDFLEAERNLLLYTSLIQQGQTKEALKPLQSALQSYEKIGYRSRSFICICALANTYANLSCFREADQLLARAQQLILEPKEEVELAKSNAWNLSQQGRRIESMEQMDHALELMRKQSLPYSRGVFLLAARVYLRAKDFVRAHSYFSQCRESLKRGGNEILFFQYLLLDSLVSRNLMQSIPATDGELRDKRPILFHQWSTVYHLKHGNRAQALNHWNHLVRANPDTYGEYFVVKKSFTEHGCFDHFILQIAQVLSEDDSAKTSGAVEASGIAKVHVTSGLSRQLRKLMGALRAQPQGIDHEQVSQVLWGVSFHPNFHSRLKRVQQQLKQKYGIAVSLNQGHMALLDD